MVDAQTNLQSYKQQLQQVEAALSIDPDNEELVKLKGDLEEVVALTKDLIKQQLTESSKKDPSSTSDTTHVQEVPFVANFHVGDLCLVLSSEDGIYYEGTIEEMTEDGDQVSVRLTHNNQVEVTSVVLLQKLNKKKAEKKKFTDGPDGKTKHITQSQRDYLKKKKLKKQQRYKQQEEERESEKNKWLAFATKKSGGLPKKSIFASPESVNGRVGIGTCGVSGLPMTEFSHAEKRKKGAQ